MRKPQITIFLICSETRLEYKKCKKMQLNKTQFNTKRDVWHT